jgi:hypothetical protein
MFALLLVDIETDPDWKTVNVDPHLEVMSIRADPDLQQWLGLYFPKSVLRGSVSGSYLTVASHDASLNPCK